MTARKLSTGYFQNRDILKNNDQLRILVAELRKERNKVLEVNCRLRKANIEIARKNKHISSINKQLETVIAEKNSDIHNLNRKIVRFAEYNAHRIRGPLATIIGLVQVMNLDFMNKKVHDQEQFEFCLQCLKKSSVELDEMVKAVTKLLNENDFPVEEVKMRYRFQRYIETVIKSLFRSTKLFLKHNPHYLLLRCTALFLGSAGLKNFYEL